LDGLEQGIASDGKFQSFPLNLPVDLGGGYPPGDWIAW
jgi:hypothetical protein